MPDGRQSFEVVPSWSAAVHADLGLPGGVILGSVYVESVPDHAHLSRNFQKLTRLGEVLRYYARPFLIAGDWNTTASELE
eukprot:7659727-Pyramimonas_sp.AAC.1